MFASRERRDYDIEDRRSISWHGLQDYLRAVSLRNCGRDEKLRLIAERFSDDATLVTPSGQILEGRKGVMAFYGSRESPVMKRPDFMPRPVNGTLRFSLDGRSLSIEIDLPTGDYGCYERVVDRFTFDEEGLITKLGIVSRGCPAKPLTKPPTPPRSNRISPVVVATTGVVAAGALTLLLERFKRVLCKLRN